MVEVDDDAVVTVAAADVAEEDEVTGVDDEVAGGSTEGEGDVAGERVIGLADWAIVLEGVPCSDSVGAAASVSAHNDSEG